MTEPATTVADLGVVQNYDMVGAIMVWDLSGTMWAAWLNIRGELRLKQSLGTGARAALSLTNGVAVLFLTDSDVRLSELNATPFECRAGAFCRTAIRDWEADPSARTLALEYHEPSDTWFVTAGNQIAVVGRDGARAIPLQTHVRDDLTYSSILSEVAVSGDTVAITHNAGGTGALTFLGCF